MSSSARYALLPEINFYEFIPIELSGEDEPQTVLMDQLQLGKDYEIVITTAVNLNRYRIGDVIRVVSFYNQVPVVEFRQRASGNLNIRGEKVTESLVYETLTVAAAQVPGLERIVDYTTCENIMLDLAEFKGNKPGARHVFFVEIATATQDPHDTLQIAEDLAEKYDNSIREKHKSYARYRATSSLERCLVFPVRGGAFNRLREHLWKTGSVAAVQVKIPRILSKKELVIFMVKEMVTTEQSVEINTS